MSRDATGSTETVGSAGTTEGASAETGAESTADATGGGLRDRLSPTALPLRHQLGLLGLVVLALLPLGLEPIAMLTMVSAFYFGMFAMSWDAVSGYTGQISFGHGLFFAVGGYTSALLNLEFGLSPILTIPVGVVLAALAGVLIGVPALRLRGPYLSLVTLVAPLILLQVFIVYSGVFGGELGLSSPDDLVGGLDPTGILLNYYLAFGLFVAILALLYAVTRSDVGAVLTAIREDEDAVSAAGLNPAKFKIFAFVLSAAIGGLAGAVFVHTPRGNPTPSQLFSVTVNIEVIIAAVLGGMGTIVGAALGGLFLVLFRDFLSNQSVVIPLLDVPVSEVDFLLFAIITLLLLFFLPEGLLRWSIHRGSSVLSRVRSEEVATDGGEPAARADDPPQKPPQDGEKS